MGRTLSTIELKRQAGKIAAESPHALKSYSENDIHTLIHDLQVYQVELEMQNDELNRAQALIEEYRQKYFELYDLAPIGYITITEDGLVQDINQTGAVMFGVPKTLTSAMPFSAFLGKSSISPFFSCLQRSMQSGDRQFCELEIRALHTSPIWIELYCCPLRNQGKEKRMFACSVLDITQRRRFEGELIRSKKELESMVALRTAELARTNRDLEKEVAKSEKARRAIKKQALQLKRRKESLEHTNTALRVILDQRQTDKRELEEKVSVNVNQLILPFVQRLKQGRLSPHQQECIESLESALNAIVSPMARELMLSVARLTASEIQVVELIRQGKTTKEIAAFLNVAKSTIDYHRNRIRKKFGLNQKKISLQDFLQTLNRPSG